MGKETVIPQLGCLVRTLITAAGYRLYLVDKGLDKNLDDLANEAENRQGTGFDTLQKIKAACIEELARDCGDDWSQLFQEAWSKTSQAVQMLAQSLDVTPLTVEEGQKLLAQHFTVPMLSGLFRLLSARQRAAPDVEAWWKNPFQAWLSFASRQTGIAEEVLLDKEILVDKFDIDPRTITRWFSGEPVNKLSWPYAPKVTAVLGEEVTNAEVRSLAGWLLLARAYQSLSLEMREAARHDFNLRQQQPWELKNAIRAINKECFHAGDIPVRKQATQLFDDIQKIFSVRPLDSAALRSKLNQLQHLIEQMPPSLRKSYEYIHHYFSARHAALLEKKQEALDLYAKAVTGAWWCAGRHQRPILREALVYAVGVGAKDAANAYWDKTFMLGLNQGLKRSLDEQEMRRISFEFERLFSSQKAKVRIPPSIEILLGEDATFKLNKKHLENPNRKIKHAEGRTRRTPLMDAIFRGALDDVKQLIAAGGDPNDFIPESGEGPLSCAMRLACNRKDTGIMDYLLELDLLQETVNRPASTKRETPLKIAIEMANAHAVARLIELGANVEQQPCDGLPSGSLSYALDCLCRSLDPKRQELELSAYLSGETPADVYDAKGGAILDTELAARRQRQLAGFFSSERKRQWDAMMDYPILPPEDYRAVIRALLAGGADANRRYRVDVHARDEWTPTLCAAEIGDLEVFKMLLEHGGDPDLTLVPPTTLECHDALWVAYYHKRVMIVSYLQERSRLSH